MSPYGGVVAERFERIHVMAVSDLLAAASQAALAVLVLAGASAPVIIAVAAITAVVMTPYEPAIAAVTPQMVGEDDLAAANSLRGVIENVVQVGGPALGALQLLIAPAWSVFALDAATFVLSAIIVLRIRMRSRPVDVTKSRGARRSAAPAHGGVPRDRAIGHRRSARRAFDPGDRGLRHGHRAIRGRLRGAARARAGRLRSVADRTGRRRAARRAAGQPARRLAAPRGRAHFGDAALLPPEHRPGGERVHCGGGGRSGPARGGDPDRRRDRHDRVTRDRAHATARVFGVFWAPDRRRDRARRADRAGGGGGARA